MKSVCALQFSAPAELCQTEVLIGTFEMCARLRECALVCANVRSLCALGLASIKVISHLSFLKCINALVSEIAARSTCLRAFRQKPVQNSKQPEMNARFKMQVFLFATTGFPVDGGSFTVILEKEKLD